jgi:hypothetical protein
MEEARAIVEQALTTLGLVPSEVLVSKAGAAPAWTMKRGSANVAVALVTREALGTSAVHLRVVAPMLVFAQDTKPELFHHVLKLNAAGLSWCAFGVLGESLVLVAERPTEDLDPSEVVHTVQHVAALADTFDDRLVTEFGGQRSCDA